MRNTVYKEGATNEQIAEAIACAMFVAAGSQLSCLDFPISETVNSYHSI